MTITVDTGNISVATPVANAFSPQTFSHTCGANVKLLVVVVTIYDTSSGDGVVSGVTYNGNPLASATLYYDSLCDGHVSVWWMTAPDTGSSYTVEVTFGGVVTDFEAAAVGVNGTLGAYGKDSNGTPATGTTGDLVISWPTVAEDTIVFAAALDDQTAAGKVTPQETEIYTVDVGDVVSTEYAIRSSSGSQTLTIADSDGDEDWVIVGAGFYEIVGATEYQQSTDGALTPIGTIVKSSGKILAGIITLTGSISKATTKTFTGSSTLAGALVKQAQKIFTGTSTLSGLLSTTKVTLLSIGGVLSPVGILVKRVSKVFTGATTATGSLIKSTAKSITRSLTLSGVVNTTKVTLLAIGGSITASGALIKQTALSLIGLVTAAGSLAAQKAGVGGEEFYKAVGGVVIMAGVLTEQRGKQLAGIINMAGAVFRHLIGLPTPARQIFAIAAESRIFPISSENRIYSVPRGVRP